MSKRRQRCLKTLGYNDYITWDITDKEPIQELVEQYKPNTMIISSPPLTKQPYITLANNFSLIPFCEADIQTYSGDYYPSSTMRFHPAITKIKELIDNGTLGNVYTFTHHCGNHIADWHPGADMKTYYAAQKETGGCKEIFPFELSWLSWLFGEPKNAVGMINKTLNDKDITADDVYTTACKLGNITGTILIDIVSRPAIRELRIVGEKGIIEWNWNEDFVYHKFADGLNQYQHYVPKGQAAEGYHSAICEQMYIDEIKAFINSITPTCGNCEYINPKEKQPHTTSHCCTKYNKQLLHRGYHPDLCKLDECKSYFYTKAEEEHVIKMLRRVEGK